MDVENEIVFWSIVAMCLAGLIVARVRLGTVPRGWAAVWGAILVVAVAGRLAASATTVYAAGLAWLVLVAAPTALANLGGRLLMRRRYAAARRAFRLVALLHPADGFREVPAAVTAMEMAHAGDLAGAAAALERVRHAESALASTALCMLYALEQRWDDLVAWAAAHPTAVARDHDLLIFVLRALGETGDVAGLVDRYERERRRIELLGPSVRRDTSRLVLFAFGGRPDVVDRVLSSGFSSAPSDQNRFWQATARWAAGDVEAARGAFAELLPVVDLANAVAIRRRLSLIEPAPAPLDERRRAFLDAEAVRLEQESRFTGSVSLFSRQARVCRAMIAINAATFALQTLSGSVADGARIHDAGALCSECVGRGEWWRLASSTCLHWNTVHLVMNLLGLGVFGPAAEAGLGAARFLAVYAVSGIGSMATVAAAAWLRGEPQLCVGASGAVMGVIGATAAMMLRGWACERAAAAWSRGLSMVGFVVWQAAIDALVPQFSFTGHLAGAVIGLVAALVLGDRLRR